ncbi:hypothetical protein SUGI_0555440 [Cryptomeria japonica]|uniref:probable LRR receptor-like serine/threonine-protein kinase At3g47570 n=1 Tax=Cryptomeria japonica TaxID=3369 RepID=UPI002408EE64|nr:probable LRR receptor-like serine/threonine-protein kinase At3g47570 [Cryptomeria japonica]GLJ28262.1 hypothetical protein SUGI_0555440 [Cryptomeria japonica]
MAPLMLLSFMLSIFSISGLPHSPDNLSHEQQQHLLLQFKSAISNNNKTSLADWTPHLPLCNWTGITCDPSSHSILALNVSYMNLDGTISPVLGNLSSLQSLDLSTNALTGHIPPQLGQLRHLQTLWLDENKLQGIIPPSLSDCRSLISLALSRNQLHGRIPPELSLLPSLNYLDLSVNNLTGTLSPSLGNLSTLVAFGVADNDLTGTIPVELGSLSQLQVLSLYRNQLSGPIPSSLGNLSVLINLALASNHLQGPIPPEVGMLTQLQVIDLFDNHLSGNILSSLTNLSKLNELLLFENRLSGHIPWEIGTKLTKLQILSLWGNQLNGNIPNSIGNCSSLTALGLNDNMLSGMVPKELGKLSLLTRLYLQMNQLVSTSKNTLDFFTALTNCSHLENIGLSYNRITGILPPSIGQLSSSLIDLDLKYNMISGTIPQQIANLTNLNSLDLSNNLFSGSIPFVIKRFHKLERLYLGGNKLQGTIPGEIGQMQHLGLLNLSHNQLSGKIPDSLCNSQQLRYLYFQHNNLSGEIPASLKQCQKLELLDLSYNKLGGRIPRDVIASLKNLQFYLNLSWNSLQGFLPKEMSKIVMAQAIDISGNQLTGVIPNALGDCTNLERLNLSHNAFEGPIPKSLSKLQNLQEMDVSFNNLSGRIPEGGLFPNRTVITLFMGNLGLCGPKNYSLPPCPNQTQKTRSLLRKIVLSVVGTIAFVLFIFIIGMLWRQKLSRQPFRLSNFIFRRLSYPKFSYEDLVLATSGFDEANLIGVGNFGSVYRGILRDGKTVAIKALNLQNEEAQKSFNIECKLLGRIRHRNLVKIISAFYYPGFQGLVLQFASNGSLEKHLHLDRDDQGFCELGFNECLNIAIDVAHGMEYLHHDCPLQIVHCDLKPSNVLLDDNMTALVTDFGISRLTSTPSSTDSLTTTTFALRGSIGYIAPEYGLGGSVSIKGDVYSYGILILEMVTRKRPSDDMFVGDMTLQKWVRLSFPNRLADIVDNRLLSDVNANMEENGFLLSFIYFALLCANESPRERPSMRDVAMALENLRTSFTGNAASSNLASSISDLLHDTNPTALSASDSSSTF